MTRKSTMLLNRISSIFHSKDDVMPSADSYINSNTLASGTASPSSALHNNSSIQRAPSSKLLIDDLDDISSLDYSYDYSDLHYHNQTEEESPVTGKHSNRQSWFPTLSKLKTLKKNKKRKSGECWFIQQRLGGTEFEAAEVSSDQQKKRLTGVIVEKEEPRKLASSPLSIASSLNNNFSSCASTSSWIPLYQDSGVSTARTSIDSRHQVDEKPHQPKSYLVVPEMKKPSIHLAENVKNILGDAIFLADQELDI